jgi:hypothetical protein
MSPFTHIFFFVAYDCVCEGGDELDMTIEDVYLHDHTAFQDVILKSRQQTDWRFDILHGNVLRSGGKHLLKFTGKQFTLLKCTGKQFSLFKCKGNAVDFAEMYGKAVDFAEMYGKAVDFA